MTVLLISYYLSIDKMVTKIEFIIKKRVFS